MSYIELYNENVNDLLDSTKTNLNIRELKGKGGIYIEQLSEHQVNSLEETLILLNKGDL